MDDLISEESTTARLLKKTWNRDILSGFVDQGLTSTVNFALTLVSGRLLGPAGLGRIFLGFASYLIVLGLLRALVSDPYLTLPDNKVASERLQVQKLALGAALLFALGAGFLFFLGGALVGGDIGRGLLLFAPWIVPSLMHDYFRSILFLDGKGSSAALISGLWLLSMAAILFFAQQAPSELLITTSWGLGATAGMLVGLAKVGSLPSIRLQVLRWWHLELLPVAGWFAGGSAMMAIGFYLAPFLLLGVIGPADLGGLRAVQSIFAPISLVGAALTLPGLPHLMGRLAISVDEARSYGFRLTALAVSLVSIYLVVVAVGRTRFMSGLFGSSFGPYLPLVIPIGVGQILAAGYLGPVLFLKGLRRGRALTVISSVMSLISVAASVVLALAFGVEGAAWGLTLGLAVGTTLMVVRALTVAE